MHHEFMILPVGEERQVGHRDELRPDGVHRQVRRAGVVGVAADVAHESLEGKIYIRHVICNLEVNT